MATDQELLLDLLQAAWGVDDVELEQLLGLSKHWLASHRNHDVAIGPAEHAGLQKLLGLHEALRLVVRPAGYSEWLRRSWRAESPISGRTPLQVMLEDGDDGIALIQALCRSS
jgi:hypothetical protein